MLWVSVFRETILFSVQRSLFLCVCPSIFILHLSIPLLRQECKTKKMASALNPHMVLRSMVANNGDNSCVGVTLY